MIRLLLSVFLLGFIFLTAGCQAFLEDYNYQPIQDISSNST